MSEDRSSKFVIALGVFVCLFILSGCSPKVIPPIWEKKCTIDDYYRASEPLGSDYMDSIERTISGDLNFEDFPAELVIAERLKNSVDNVLCGDAFPDLNTHLVNSIHYYQLGLEAILQEDRAKSDQYMETSRQYFIDYFEALDAAYEASVEEGGEDTEATVKQMFSDAQTETAVFQTAVSKEITKQAPPPSATFTFTPAPTDTPRLTIGDVYRMTHEPKATYTTPIPQSGTQPSIPDLWLQRINDYCTHKYNNRTVEGGVELSEWYYIAICTRGMVEEFLKDPNNTQKEIMDALN